MAAHHGLGPLFQFTESELDPAGTVFREQSIQPLYTQIQRVELSVEIAIKGSRQAGVGFEDMEKLPRIASNNHP